MARGCPRRQYQDGPIDCRARRRGNGRATSCRCRRGGRRSGRVDPGNGSGLARRRRHRAGIPGVGRAAQRQVESRLGTFDGNLPAARRGAEGARRRTAGGLSQRRGLSHHVSRTRNHAHQNSVPRRALHGQRRPGYLVADAGAAAPDQPDLPRTGVVRPFVGNARRAHFQRHVIGRFHARRGRRHGLRHRETAAESRFPASS